MAEPATELSLDTAAVLAAEEHEVAIVGRSPWYLAWRRLRRNYVALFALFVFIVIVDELLPRARLREPGRPYGAERDAQRRDGDRQR